MRTVVQAGKTELIEQIEDAFAISIPEEDAKRAHTAGDLHRIVLSRVIWGATREAARAEYVTRRALADGLGIPRATVQPESRLEGLMPQDRRTEHWATVLRSTHFKFPALRYSKRRRDSIMLASMAIAAVPLVALWWALWALDWIRGIGVYLFSMPAALGFLLLESRVDKHLDSVMRSRATEPPTDTVRELTEAVLEMNQQAFNAEQGKAKAPSSLMVWEKIVDVIHQAAGVETAQITATTAIPELLRAD